MNVGASVLVVLMKASFNIMMRLSTLLGKPKKPLLFRAPSSYTERVAKGRVLP